MNKDCDYDSSDILWNRKNSLWLNYHWFYQYHTNFNLQYIMKSLFLILKSESKKNVISQTCKTLAIHENWPPQIQMVSHNLELNVWETVSVELSSIDRAPTHCPMRWTLIWSTQGNKPSPTSREAPSSPVTTPSPWSEGTCTQLIIHPQMTDVKYFSLNDKSIPCTNNFIIQRKIFNIGGRCIHHNSRVCLVKETY